MKYNDITRRYFDAAPNAGTLAGESVLRGSAGDIKDSCWVQFHVRLQGDLVGEARFLALGCPHTIAVCAYLTERGTGMALRSDLPEDLESLERRFSVPGEKRGRLLVIEDAWSAMTGRVR